MTKKEGMNKVSTSIPPESGFALRAYENGILDPLSSKPPKNIKDIQKRHCRGRETPSPPESVCNDYLDTVESSANEATRGSEVRDRLLKTYPNEGYKRALNQEFTGFPEDVGFNNGLSAPQPDYIEGLRMREYRPFPVNKHISGAVLYQDDPNSITLPHLAGGLAGCGKDMKEARLQSAFYGAALVYARNQALSSIGKPDTPGHAEVTTFTTDGNYLNFFAHYATQSEDGTLEYHQYPFASANLSEYKEFKNGRRGLRNEQDHAREESYALKDRLKENWKQRKRSGGTLYPENANGGWKRKFSPPSPDGFLPRYSRRKGEHCFNWDDQSLSHDDQSSDRRFIWLKDSDDGKVLYSD